MGGKDAIVVDENIDTDLGRINYNVAFGFSGQNVLHVHVPSYTVQCMMKY